MDCALAHGRVVATVPLPNGFDELFENCSMFVLTPSQNGFFLTSNEKTFSNSKRFENKFLKISTIFVAKSQEILDSMRF